MREVVKLGETLALKLTPETLTAQIVAAGSSPRHRHLRRASRRLPRQQEGARKLRPRYTKIDQQPSATKLLCDLS